MKKEYLIMSVDDENDIRDSIKSVLEDEGFKVETAKDGASMLKKLEKIIHPQVRIYMKKFFLYIPTWVW